MEGAKVLEAFSFSPSLLRVRFFTLAVYPQFLPLFAVMAELDRPIDLVDVFRRADETPPHAREAVEAGAGALWLQLGIVSAESRRIAEEAGLDYVEDLCTAVVHADEIRA